MYPGGGIDKPVLIIRDTAAEADGEDSRVVVLLEEARSLIDALVEAGAWLAVHQVGQSPPELRQTGREESHD